MRKNQAMDRRLPPLGALRTFDAAARHLSFKKAADELAVTQGAVSRQVQNLERYFNQSLFVRGHRRITLTPAGERLKETTAACFDLIADVTRDLMRPSHLVRLKAAPTIATCWLIPRLPDFEARHPSVDVQIWTSADDATLPREPFDGALVYGDQVTTSVASIPIFTDRATLVATPAIAETVATLADLDSHRLMLTVADAWDWRLWFETKGHPWPPRSRRTVFTTDDQAIKAIIEGHGIGLMDLRFVRKELDNGTVVPVFPEDPAVAVGQYCLTYAKTQERNPAFVLFRDWIVAQAQADGG